MRGVVGAGTQVERAPGDDGAVPERPLERPGQSGRGGARCGGGGQDVPFPRVSAMCSAWRMARATMVSVGFAAAPVVITEPSLT